VDKVLIGGAMVFTFYRAQGHPTGKSLVEEGLVADCQGIIDEAARLGVKLVLAPDVVVAASATENAVGSVVKAADIPADMVGLDVGPETLEVFGKELEGCKTVMWNGEGSLVRLLVGQSRSEWSGVWSEVE
jgi:phosphoglycerate kinase